MGGREIKQKIRTFLYIHIIYRYLTRYSISGFSPWVLRDGENSLGINASSQILKCGRMGQVMLCSWRQKPERVLCPEMEREREKTGEGSRRRRGRWGEGAGERGGQPCPHGLVLRVLRSALPERVRKVPCEDKATLLRRPSGLSGHQQRWRTAAGCANKRRHCQA